MLLLAVMPAVAKKKVTTPEPQVPQSTDNMLTEQEQREGWKLLWDGKTTEGWRGAKLTTSPARWHAREHGIGKLVVGESLGSGIKEQLRIQALSYHAQAEYLTQHTCYLERRTGLFNALTSPEEVDVMITGALGHLRQLILHGLSLFLRNDTERTCKVPLSSKL